MGNNGEDLHANKMSKKCKDLMITLFTIKTVICPIKHFIFQTFFMMMRLEKVMYVCIVCTFI